MIIIKFSNLWVCALCVVLSVTPNTKQIWSIQYCSAEYSAQTELKLFPRGRKPCATRHWNTRCVTQDVVSCGAPVQGAGPLHRAQSALAHGEGRWGSAWISTSLVLSYPSEAGRAKSSHCRCFVEWGQLSRGKSRTLHPAEPLQSQHWLCFLCLCGAWSWPLSDFSRDNICRAICESLDTCTDLLRNQSHLPDHNVPGFSFLPSWDCCCSQLKLCEHGRGEEIGHESEK